MGGHRDLSAAAGRRRWDRVFSSDGWLSTKQACARLGVGLHLLYRLIDHGQLPAFKVGRLIRIRTVDLDRYIEAAKIEPGTLGHLRTGRPN